MKFLVTYRTRISQILGLAFVVLFLVSGKPLEMAAREFDTCNKRKTLRSQ